MSDEPHWKDGREVLGKIAVHIPTGGVNPDKKIYSTRDVEALCAISVAAALRQAEAMSEIKPRGRPRR